ncbi:MAG: PspC domain-containing protein [Candidatus Aminicenantia bacterium]
MKKRLYRSTKDKMIAGICGGIGEYFDVDPTIIRLALVLIGLISAIIPCLIFYLIAWIIVPVKPEKPTEKTKKEKN